MIVAADPLRIGLGWESYHIKLASHQFTSLHTYPHRCNVCITSLFMMVRCPAVKKRLAKTISVIEAQGANQHDRDHGRAYGGASLETLDGLDSV